MSGARLERPLFPDTAVRPRERLAKPRLAGRYVILGAIGSGGCATVHLGRLVSEGGFSRTVAVKRLLSEYSADPDFVAMFLDEARLVARIHHPNVVPSLDVFWHDCDRGPELFMVMEYVAGETLARLLAESAMHRERPPTRVVLAIVRDVLKGLEAAHEATSASGEPLGLVHRDVSPQNIMIGIHGSARLLDFGIAKAAGRSQVTRQGDFKGKAAYMAPEQIFGRATKLSDVYSASVVLWEALTGQRLFVGESSAAILHKVATRPVERPGAVVEGVSPAIDAIAMRGLARDPDARFRSAQEMADAIEAAGALASPGEVSSWLHRMAEKELRARAADAAFIEGLSASDLVGLSAATGPPAAPDASNAPRTPVDDGLAAARPSRAPRRVIVKALGVGLLVILVPVGVLVARQVRTGPLGGRVAPGIVASTARTEPSPAEGSRSPPPPADEPAPRPVAAPAESSPPRAAMVRAAPASQPRARAETRPACSPPFVMDSEGTIHFKTECL